jgi:hypothetical protein
MNAVENLVVSSGVARTAHFAQLEITRGLIDGLEQADRGVSGAARNVSRGNFIGAAGNIANMFGADEMGGFLNYYGKLSEKMGVSEATRFITKSGAASENLNKGTTNLNNDTANNEIVYYLKKIQEVMNVNVDVAGKQLGLNEQTVKAIKEKNRGVFR